MLRATDILPAGRWPKELQRDEITLDFDSRHRRRLRLVADGGLEFLLDLPEAAVMHQGDGLKLEDGGIVCVVAAREPLLEITAPTPEHLMRLAWHIGNRHLPAELHANRLYIRDDHVIAEMVRGLGGTARQVRSAFTPEGGAYRGEPHHHQARGHGHAHGHEHHDHDHPHHDHKHDHD
jgi:urease accessory protein